MAVNQLQSAALVMQAFCRDVCGMRFLPGSKSSKVQFPSVHLDSGSPRKHAAWIGGDAKHPSGAVRGWRVSTILRVFLKRQFPQIVPAVVGTFSVDVVGLIGRHATNHVEKCEAMGNVQLANHANTNVSVTVNATGFVSSLASTSVDKPRKGSGEWIVLQSLAERLRRNVWFSHASFYSVGRV